MLVIEYTIQNLTLIAISVAESVADHFELARINLNINSYGGPIALNIPMIRPQWTDNDSRILLRAISSNATLRVHIRVIKLHR